MRPVDKGTAPVAAYTNYAEALPDLEQRLGRYCSYCERYIATNLAVEHVQAKSGAIGGVLDWHNLALEGCVAVDLSGMNRVSENSGDGEFLRVEARADGLVLVAQREPALARQRARGRRVLGLLMAPRDTAEGCRAQMWLTDVDNGDAYLVSQPLGAGSSGCAADPQGFARASRVLRDAVLSLAAEQPFARGLVNSGRLSVPATLVNSPLNTPDDDVYEGWMVPGAPADDALLPGQGPGGSDGWLLAQLPMGFVLLLFTVVFPWLEPRLPFNDVTVDETPIPGASVPVSPSSTVSFVPSPSGS